MRAKKHSLVLVTAPDLKTARKLARSVVSARLAACVSLVPRLESHYWWQGQIEVGAEVLMILKTTSLCLRRLEKHIVEQHPYDTPEFITFSITSGNRRYLAWLEETISVGHGQ